MNPDTDPPGKEMPVGQTVQSGPDSHPFICTSIDPAVKFYFDPMPPDIRTQFEQNEYTIRGIQCNELANFDHCPEFNTHTGIDPKKLMPIYDRQLWALYAEILDEGNHLTRLRAEVLQRHALLQQGQLSDFGLLSNLSVLVAASTRRCYGHRLRYNRICLYRSKARAQINEQAGVKKEANQAESHTDIERLAQTAPQTPADNLDGADPGLGDTAGIPISDFMTACDRGRRGDLGGQGDSGIPRGPQGPGPVNLIGERWSGERFVHGHVMGTGGYPGPPVAAGDVKPTGPESCIGSDLPDVLPDLVGPTPSALPFHHLGQSGRTAYAGSAGFQGGIAPHPDDTFDDPFWYEQQRATYPARDDYATRAILQRGYDIPTVNPVGGGFGGFGPDTMGTGIYGQNYGHLPPPFPALTHASPWSSDPQRTLGGPIGLHQVETTFDGNAVLSDGTIHYGASGSVDSLPRFLHYDDPHQNSHGNVILPDGTIAPRRDVIHRDYYYGNIPGSDVPPVPTMEILPDGTIAPRRVDIRGTYHYVNTPGNGPSSLSVGPPSSYTGEGLDHTGNWEYPADAATVAPYDYPIVRMPGTDSTPGEGITQPVRRHTVYRDNYRGRNRGRHRRIDHGTRRRGVRISL